MPDSLTGKEEEKLPPSDAPPLGATAGSLDPEVVQAAKAFLGCPLSMCFQLPRLPHAQWHCRIRVSCHPSPVGSWLLCPLFSLQPSYWGRSDSES